MLTLEKLKEMKPNTIFASGIALDNPDGINMMNQGVELRWVAQRGGIHDWCIYVHYKHLYNNQQVADFGDKVFSSETIRKLVPCDEAAFKMYRY